MNNYYVKEIGCPGEYILCTQTQSDAEGRVWYAERFTCAQMMPEKTALEIIKFKSTKSESRRFAILKPDGSYSFVRFVYFELKGN